jgi:hypothetical protein
VGHNAAKPIHYRYRFVAPSNTGIPSGFDLDNNGTVGGPNDAFGFGAGLEKALAGQVEASPVGLSIRPTRAESER